ncbi:MAG: hypothetical protein ABI686_01545 [Acidobacteriota bacterium]
MLRRYLQQNVIGDGWTGDVATDEQAAARSRELGVKVEVEAIGKDESGKTIYKVAISDEDLAKLRQVKAEWQTKKAEQARNNEQARTEVNNLAQDTAGLFEGVRKSDGMKQTPPAAGCLIN